MKMQILTNSAGQILATAPVGLIGSGNDAPMGARMVARAGQFTHEVDVPDDVAKLPSTEFSKRFCVEFGGAARLVDPTQQGQKTDATS